jgi:hypothetical protein
VRRRHRLVQPVPADVHAPVKGDFELLMRTLGDSDASIGTASRGPLLMMAYGVWRQLLRGISQEALCLVGDIK